jgi:antitoxin (DNA-binding transcriptional repressor) of toxin-antitoxin stability system
MTSPRSLGLEQARARLPAIAALANSGKTSVITRHGKPYAAIVSVEMALAKRSAGQLLGLRGSGKGLWGKSAGTFVRTLRDEWR